MMKKKLYQRPILSIFLVAILYLIPVMGLGAILNSLGVKIHYSWFAPLVLVIVGLIFFIIIPRVFKLPNGKKSIKEYLKVIKLDESRINLRNFLTGILVWSIIMLSISAMLAIIGKFQFNISEVIPVPFGQDVEWGIIFSLVPAIFEEVAARGIAFSILRRKYSVKTVMIITSALFAVGHIFGGISISMVWTFLMGMIFVYTYIKTDSLFTSIVAHYLFNTFSDSLNLYDSLLNATFIEEFIVLIGGTGIALLIVIMFFNANVFKNDRKEEQYI